MNDSEKVRQADHPKPAPCLACQEGRFHAHDWREVVPPVTTPPPTR
jgi:hypothetical protein